MIWTSTLDTDLMSAIYDLSGLDKALTGHHLPMPLLMQLRDMVASMNCYYSNLIEGVHTKITDIDTTLSRPDNKSMSLLAAAHIKTSHSLIAMQQGRSVYDPKYIRDIHAAFFDDLPEEHKKVRYPDGFESIVKGGELRKNNVSVGDHAAPSASSVQGLLNDFYTAYSNTNSNMLKAFNALSSHHRLAWIHPFSDGNGRTARLHTEAALMDGGIGVSQLWSLSRGLAFRQDDYYAALKKADNLQDHTLQAFVEFLIVTATEQITFMKEKVNLDDISDRYLRIAKDFDMPKGADVVIGVLLRTGSLSKSEVPALIGKTDRTARTLVSSMLKIGIIREKNYSEIEIGLSPLVGAIILPDLFPYRETVAAVDEIGRLCAR
jgi:Fic family protein